MKFNQTLEIRGKEKKISQKDKEYLIVRCEDIETGEAYELYEPNAENYEYYKRGSEAIFNFELSQYRGNWQIKILDFKLID